ncbi:hypothetical protein GGX14DRAFT_611118 [Mycena pura]|uniref:Poly(A) polymerase RNA-binding domain-containing protein n=1 Tax=Mycena pura TaxID=153505 RepID=A0AAD6VKW2_9AGAR|nr:hypothetical protein GGX14DRAFT_611118 [Mycena pura]
MTRAHTFCKGFNSTVRCVPEEEASAVMRGQPPAAPDAESAEDDPENAAAPLKVYLTSFKFFIIGLAVRPRCDLNRHVSATDTVPQRFDVSFPISEFIKMVKGETFDETAMGITLKHIRRCIAAHADPLLRTLISRLLRSTALPEYVFDRCEFVQRWAAFVAWRFLKHGLFDPRPPLLQSTDAPAGLGATVLDMIDELVVCCPPSHAYAHPPSHSQVDAHARGIKPLICMHDENALQTGDI